VNELINKVLKLDQNNQKNVINQIIAYCFPFELLMNLNEVIGHERYFLELEISMKYTTQITLSDIHII